MAVAVGVIVGVAVEVAVGVGVGPLPPQTIISLSVHTAVCPARRCGTLLDPVAVQSFMLGLYLPPVSRYNGGPKELPPQIIISLPVQTAVCPNRGAGAAVFVAVQLSITGLYLAPVFRLLLVLLRPPQTIISPPDQSAV